MNALSYILAVNFGLATTVILLILSRGLMSMAGLRIRARSEVLMLRISLAILLAAPVTFEVLRQLAGLPRVSLEMISLPGSALDRLVTIGAEIAQGPSYPGAALLALCGFQLARFVYQAAALHRITAKYRLTWRSGRIKIRRCAAGGMAFAFADLTTTTIIVPDRLSPTERRAVILHEIMHVRHRDLLWNWGIGAVSVICVWNPFYWLLRQWHTVSVELAVDQKVTRSRSIGLASYLNSLLSMAARQSISNRPAIAGQAFFTNGHFGRFLIRRRIKDALEPRPFSKSAVLPGVIVAVLMLNWSVSTAELSLRNWTVQSLSQSTETNRMRLRELLGTAERYHAFH